MVRTILALLFSHLLAGSLLLPVSLAQVVGSDRPKPLSG
jgi:hypothetical protein